MERIDIESVTKDLEEVLTFVDHHILLINKMLNLSQSNDYYSIKTVLRQLNAFVENGSLQLEQLMPKAQVVRSALPHAERENLDRYFRPTFLSRYQHVSEIIAKNDFSSDLTDQHKEMIHRLFRKHIPYGFDYYPIAENSLDFPEKFSKGICVCLNDILDNLSEYLQSPDIPRAYWESESKNKLSIKIIQSGVISSFVNNRVGSFECDKYNMTYRFFETTSSGENYLTSPSNRNFENCPVLASGFVARLIYNWPDINEQLFQTHLTSNFADYPAIFYSKSDPFRNPEMDEDFFRWQQKLEYKHFKESQFIMKFISFDEEKLLTRCFNEYLNYCKSNSAVLKLTTPPSCKLVESEFSDPIQERPENKVFLEKKSIILNEFDLVDSNLKWRYIFRSEKDRDYFADILARYFSGLDCTLSTYTISINKHAKCRTAATLKEIHKKVSEVTKLAHDHGFLRIVKLLSSFSQETEKAIYNKISRS